MKNIFLRNKMLLLIFCLIDGIVFAVIRLDFWGDKSDMVKEEVIQLLSEKSYSGEQLYDFALETRGKGEGHKEFCLLKEAANKGMDYAQFELGRCYYYGKIAERNPSLGMKWMTKAAE